MFRALTGRELKIKIAAKLKVPEDALATTRVTNHIDECLLEYFQTQALSFTDPKSKPISSSSKAPQQTRKQKATTTTSSSSSSTVTKKSDIVDKTLKKSTTKNNVLTSKYSNTIERLKTFIVKCGMRRIWKRELDGLDERQQVARLEEILHKELGMEGRPTLEKCKAIKERREFEEELKALDPQNVLPTKLRSQRHPSHKEADIVNHKDDTIARCQDDAMVNHNRKQKNNIYSSNHDDNDAYKKRSRLDLSALGDSEE